MQVPPFPAFTFLHGGSRRLPRPHCLITGTRRRRSITTLDQTGRDVSESNPPACAYTSNIRYRGRLSGTREKFGCAGKVGNASPPVQLALIGCPRLHPHTVTFRGNPFVRLFNRALVTARANQRFCKSQYMTIYYSCQTHGLHGYSQSPTINSESEAF